MADKPKPADSCSGCGYKDKTNPEKPGWLLCRRHAPSPGQEEFRVAHWPWVKPSGRCGVGVALGDGGWTSCYQCGHWSPGAEPDFRGQNRPKEWWAQAGICYANAPWPSDEDGRKTFWRVTGALEGCGDAATVQAEGKPEPA